MGLAWEAIVHSYAPTPEIAFKYMFHACRSMVPLSNGGVSLKRGSLPSSSSSSSSSLQNQKLLGFALECLRLDVNAALKPAFKNQQQQDENWLGMLNEAEMRELLLVWEVPEERFKILVEWAKASLNWNQFNKQQQQQQQHQQLESVKASAVSACESEASKTESWVGGGSDGALSDVSYTTSDDADTLHHPDAAISTESSVPSSIQGTTSPASAQDITSSFDSEILTKTSQPSSAAPASLSFDVPLYDFSDAWLKDPVKVDSVCDVIAPLFQLVDMFNWEGKVFISAAKRYIDAGVVNEATKECINFKFGAAAAAAGPSLSDASLSSFFKSGVEAYVPPFDLPGCSITLSKELSKALALEFRTASASTNSKGGKNIWNKCFKNGSGYACPDDSAGLFLHLIQPTVGTLYAIVRRPAGVSNCCDIVFEQALEDAPVKRHVMRSRAGMGYDKNGGRKLPPYLRGSYEYGCYLTLPSPVSISKMSVINADIESFCLS